MANDRRGPPLEQLVNGHYIELVDGTGRSYTDLIDGELRTDPNDPSVCYHTPGAYDGSQFAELNCQAYGALYQDVLTVPGTTLHWSLAHRGRAGSDSMALLIAPVAVAQQITEILTQASADMTGGSVRSALDRTVDYNGQPVTIRSFMVGGEMTDGNTAWVTHRGDYTVAAGQYLSRFFFLALSCASGDRREGNLLDKVWFSTEPEPPVMGSGSLQLTKAVEQDAYRTEAAAALSKARQELTALLAASGRPADALEPKFTCKLCQDTGSVQGRTCTCVHKLMQGLRREEIEALSSLSISSFDTMELRYYPNTMDEKLGEPVRTYMGGLLEDLRSYAEEFDHNSESLMLFGNAGLGKTHAALAIAGIVLQKDFDVIYVSSPDFFGKLERPLRLLRGCRDPAAHRLCCRPADPG